MTQGMPNWLKKWLSCFKFADDGTMFIAHQNMETCHQLMQKLCNELTKWCKRNRLVINCEENKTEAIVLNTGNTSYTQLPPQLLIDGKQIRYVRSTKVLGLILDEDLNFKEHAERILKQCNSKWSLITKSNTRNHGLNIWSLLLLFKSTIITKLMYAAPLWLWKNLCKYASFWSNAIMKISGAMLNPHRMLTEVALHLPPLEVQLEIQTAKFLCKVFTRKDEMTSTLLQIDGSLQKEFHQQLLSLKKYILWSNPNAIYRRVYQVELFNLKNNKVYHYDTDVMQKYLQFIWITKITTNELGSETDTHVCLMDIISKMKTCSFLLKSSNSIFSHHTTRREDSHILDYIHGNSLLFGNVRQSVYKEDRQCYFCGSQEDSPVHQLFYCTELSDSSLNQLRNMVDITSGIIKEVLIPTLINIHKIFIMSVKYIMQMHDSLQLQNIPDYTN